MHGFTPTPAGSTEVVPGLAARHKASREELLAEIEQLEDELARLRRERNDEQAENERLGDRLQRPWSCSTGAAASAT